MMKKIISVLLLIGMAASFVACSSPAEEPQDDITIGSTAAATATPQATPTLATQDNNTEAPVSATPMEPTPEPTPEANIDPTSTSTPSGKKVSNLKEAQKINAEAVYGWIKVPNTNIDYPILYDKDWYYNTHDIYKKKSDSGSIYSYYKVLTKNSIITGHNMRVAGTMFHGLHDLQDNKEKLKEKANRTFEVDWFGITKWEVFALYETQDSESPDTLKYNTQHLGDKTDSEVAAWVNKQKSRSEIDLGVDVASTDFLMTLVTCGDNYDYSTAQSRLYFFLKAPAPKK